MLPSPLLAEMLADIGCRRVACSALPGAPVQAHTERRFFRKPRRRRRAEGTTD